MDFIWNNQNIGGGKYDIQGEGMKNGFWTEPAGGFTANSQVFTNGWYKNGNKVGRWDVIFRGQQIGYGSYEILLHQGSIKIGRWIELSNGFYDDSQVTFVGEYENGKKVGQWDIFYQENQQDKEKQKMQRLWWRNLCIIGGLRVIENWKMD
ncbi:unnamed protein product [Paramecium octaurelia]|uniref:Uncharacterized protein n=1 Tax=Paramecium octaurelia TaxID=43137 RepID=A0A8S1Y740_PAROT|nr:unnamed protein product [Paramecium octaurelia]